MAKSVVWDENTKDTIIIKADVNHGKKMNAFDQGSQGAKGKDVNGIIK